MLDLTKYTDVANKMTSFVEGIKDTNLTIMDLNKLGEIIPSLSDNLTIISNWINDCPVPVEAIPDQSVEVSADSNVDKPPVETEEPKRHLKTYQITKDMSIKISEYIAEKCNGKKTEKAIIIVSKKFKDIPFRSIQRLVKKETFDRYTDAYFMIENDIIVSFEQKIPNKFDASDESRDAIKKLLRNNNYEVIKAITPDMSANDILMIATVRWHLFRRGEVADLGGGVKEIFIMAAITRNRRANSEEIIKSINNDYHIDVDIPLISAVRTGRAYKEISSKFGVCAK
jgi:hypothetical protein